MQNKKIRIIGLTGPAAAGKTAVARKLCRQLSGKTVRISIDVLRDMSYIGAGSSKKSDEYITMAKRVVPDILKAYQKEGCDNIIVEFAPPVVSDAGQTDKWLAKKLKSLGGHVFLIHASLPEILKRNSKRHGEFGQGNLPKKLTEKLYLYFKKYIDKKDFEVIETDEFGADKTTAIILEKIK